LVGEKKGRSVRWGEDKPGNGGQKIGGTEPRCRRGN